MNETILIVNEYEMTGRHSDLVESRFDCDASTYTDLGQWMRSNLTQVELDSLRVGLCAFDPKNGLPGATRTALHRFYSAFKTTFDTTDGEWAMQWRQQIKNQSEDALKWLEWTAVDVQIALRVSDALADWADYDNVNINACIDLADDEDGLEELEELLDEWATDSDTTLVAHAQKVAEFLAGA